MFFTGKTVISRFIGGAPATGKYMFFYKKIYSLILNSNLLKNFQMTIFFLTFLSKTGKHVYRKKCILRLTENI